MRAEAVNRIRSLEIIEAKTNDQKLAAFWEATGHPDERTKAGVLAKLAEIAGG